MAKPKVPKVPPIKKVVVLPGIAGLTPAQKVTHARTTSTTCLASAAFNASTPCQASMAVWQTKADNLQKNQETKQSLLVQVGVCEQQEAVCIFEYDEAAEGFASVVKTTAAGDRAVVVSMGMGLRADPVPQPDPFTPTGVRVFLLKSTRLPKLEWDAMPGAVLYLAQMSIAPATDTSWSVLYGGGKSRKLPTLAPTQHYAFRVAAIGKDSKQSAWSDEVYFTG